MVSSQALEPLVLLLQFLKPSGFAHLHPTVLSLPTIIRLLRYLMRSACVTNLQSAFLDLSKDSDDLFYTVFFFIAVLRVYRRTNSSSCPVFVAQTSRAAKRGSVLVWLLLLGKALKIRINRLAYIERDGLHMYGD